MNTDTARPIYNKFITTRDTIFDELRTLDPDGIAKLDGKHDIDNKSNWFSLFRPQSWGYWKGSGFGIHYSVRYLFDKEIEKDCMRLEVNVESPLLDEHKESFKQTVVDKYMKTGSIASDVRLWPHAGVVKDTKLLDYTVSLDSSSAVRILKKYQELGHFTGIVGDLIKEYSRQNKFKINVMFKG